MDLFMNREAHPEVFINDLDGIKPNNQRIFTIDPLTEQKEANLSLQRRLNDLESLLEQQDTQQTNQLQTIHKFLDGLRDREMTQEQFESEVMESFVQLHAENHSFQRKLADEHVFNRQVAKQVRDVSQLTTELTGSVEGVVRANEEISREVKEQVTHQQRLSEQLVKQKDLQQTILSRLAKQEGLTERMMKQVDHLRSVLYERSSFLAEKIGGTYSTTSHFISKLLVGNEQPPNRFMVNQKQEEKRMGTKED